MFFNITATAGHAEYIYNLYGIPMRVAISKHADGSSLIITETYNTHLSTTKIIIN